MAKRKMMDQDETIKSQVKSQLKMDTRVNATDIDIEVKDGVVTLDGIVPSFRGKDAASDVALMISGVQGVENKLKVHYPMAPSPTDEEIRSRVENMLLWNPDVDSTTIDVEVSEGKVTLKGEVETYWRRLLAEDDAEAILGVQEVRNELDVIPTLKTSDKALRKDVEEALRRDILVNANELDIEVVDGEVILDGTQPSWTARDEAVTVACCMPGVRAIEDRIAVT